MDLATWLAGLWTKYAEDGLARKNSLKGPPAPSIHMQRLVRQKKATKKDGKSCHCGALDSWWADRYRKYRQAEAGLACLPAPRVAEETTPPTSSTVPRSPGTPILESAGTSWRPRRYQAYLGPRKRKRVCGNDAMDDEEGGWLAR